MRGKFIVIEGLEGAGKSTAVNTVQQFLRYFKIQDVLCTREPGGTPLSEEIRHLIKNSKKKETLTDKAELLLLYAARVQLLENLIKPALSSGTWVIGDRHDLSSQAYQGGGRGIDAQFIKSLADFTLDFFRPDLTLYLDVSPELGLKRARQRGKLDRIEQQSLTFFQLVRSRYLALARDDPLIKVIDASQPMEKVTTDIQSVLRCLLEK